ncbi:unnamed protein product [Clonostachys rosea]|uniref:Uncharacterized protein n=1 Tax=Bionectria ochroleuca TaxID=29856 RepID=A0ABY6UYY1_BIOOC|nr:unnamed protein product [Clonostachys rosea]
MAKSSLTSPVPAILCGKTLEVGEIVAPLVKPDIEIIHFINSYEYAKAHIGKLIAGQVPSEPSGNDIGSHNYSRAPRVVFFGRAFNHEYVVELNKLFRGKGNAPVAWIAGDPDTKFPANPGPDYAEKAAQNVLRAFLKWKDSGANSEEIVYY